MANPPGAGNWNWPWTLQVLVSFAAGPYDETDSQTFGGAASATVVPNTTGLNQSWTTGMYGAWGIDASGHLYMSSNKIGTNTVTVPAYLTLNGVSQGTITATLATPPGAGSSENGGLLFRYRDKNNYWWLSPIPHGSVNVYQLAKVVNGVGVLATNIAVTPTAGDVISIGLTATGFTVTINGTLRYTSTDTALLTASGSGFVQTVTGNLRWSAWSATVNYTDITQYVLEDQGSPGAMINRGKKALLDQWTAGTCDITLDNSKRVFDPLNTSGPFYGSLIPRRRIKVNLIYSGTTYTRFTGQVMEWEQNYGGFADNKVLAHCADILGVLAQVQLPTSGAWAVQVTSMYPTCWWRFNEIQPGVISQNANSPKWYPPNTPYPYWFPPPVSKAADSSGNGHDLLVDPVCGRLLFGNDSLNNYDSENASLDCGAASSDGGLLVSGFTLPNTAKLGFTIAFFIQSSSYANSFGTRVIVQQTGPSNQPGTWTNDIDSLVIGVHDDMQGITGEGVDGLLFFFVSNAGTTESAGEQVSGGQSQGDWFGMHTNPYSLNDNFMHFVVVRYWSDGNALLQGSIQVDGVERGSTDNSISYGYTAGLYPAGSKPPSQFTAAELGIARDRNPAGTRGFWNGTLDEVLIWDHYLTDADVQQLTYAALIPWWQDTTGQRISRLLQYAKIPQTMWSVDNGNTTMTVASNLGQMVLNEIQIAVVAEQGAFYALRTGQARFRSRHAGMVSPFNVSQYTFGDRSPELPYRKIVPSSGQDLIVNRAVVTAQDGTMVIAEDKVSQDVYGVQEQDMDMSVVFPGPGTYTAQDIATWLVQRFAYPLVGFSELDVQADASTALITACLNIDLEWPIEVRSRPPGSTSVIDVTSSVQGYTETFSRVSGWQIQYWLSTVQVQPFLVLDDPNTGLLGTGMLGY